MIVDYILFPLMWLLGQLESIAPIAVSGLDAYTGLAPIMAWAVGYVGADLVGMYFTSFLTIGSVRLIVGFLLWIYKLLPFV